MMVLLIDKYNCFKWLVGAVISKIYRVAPSCNIPICADYAALKVHIFANPTFDYLMIQKDMIKNELMPKQYVNET